MLNAVDLDRFATELDGLETPETVLDALHDFVQPTVCAYAAWRAPIYPGKIEGYELGRNVWFHSSVSPSFLKEFWPLADKYGPSPMSRLAYQRRRLLTWSEGMRELAVRGQESWQFDLVRKHKMRDGAYVPVGAWMVGFWSPKVLRLTKPARAFLYMAAGLAAHRLESMIEPEKIDGVVPVLTARQLGALRLVSHGHTLREIAERMGVGVATVRDYVDGARRKLKARDGHHAAFLALRLHLIA
jgi:DNA-binding CsgD family transcriptional regulator